MESVASERKLRMSHRLLRRPRCLDIWAGLLCLAVSLVLAEQTAAQSQNADRAGLVANQAQSVTGQYPSGVEGGQVVSTPNDSDLGEQSILKGEEKYQPFTASAAVPFYWTSNVALVKHGAQSDFLVAPAVALSYTPRLANSLYGFVSVSEQLFYYDRFSGLNFGDFSVQGGLIYSLPQLHGLVLRGQFIYDRLTNKNSFESFFSNYSFFLNAEMPFRIDRAQLISLGVDANISATADPEPPRRTDYDVYLGYTANISRSFYVNAVGRVVMRTYQLTDRIDVSEILSTSANFNVTKNLTASAIGTYVANQSNHSTFDYQVGNLGGLVSLTIKF
jgi:hypothetical protein